MIQRLKTGDWKELTLRYKMRYLFIFRASFKALFCKYNHNVTVSPQIVELLTYLVRLNCKHFGK